MQCCAIHAIWTTYMTWPPGDARGHWSPLFDFYGHLLDEGHHLNLCDVSTVHHATQLAKEPPKVLTQEEQDIVAETIGHILQSDMSSTSRILAAHVRRTTGSLRHGEGSLKRCGFRRQAGG
jgi:hypothetical protein